MSDPLPTNSMLVMLWSDSDPIAGDLIDSTYDKFKITLIPY